MLTDTILKLPHGPAVPYHTVLNATRETIAKLTTALTGHACTVAVSPSSQTASVIWNKTHKGVEVTLNMPAIAPTVMLPRGEADRMVALLVHELCHVRFTDRAAWYDACNDRDARLKSLVNGLEDARIERLVIRSNRIPAARELLAGLTGHYLADAIARKWWINDASQLAYGLAVLGRAKLGQRIPARCASHPPCNPSSIWRCPACPLVAILTTL
jgi:hypothetical protein